MGHGDMQVATGTGFATRYNLIHLPLLMTAVEGVSTALEDVVEPRR